MYSLLKIQIFFYAFLNFLWARGNLEIKQYILMLLVAAHFSFYNRGAVSWDLAQILYIMFIHCQYTALWINSVAECVRCILSAPTWRRLFVHVQMLDARPFDIHWSMTHPAVKVSGSECVCTRACACLFMLCFFLLLCNRTSFTF